MQFSFKIVQAGRNAVLIGFQSEQQTARALDLLSQGPVTYPRGGELTFFNYNFEVQQGLR